MATTPRKALSVLGSTNKPYKSIQLEVHADEHGAPAFHVGSGEGRKRVILPPGIAFVFEQVPDLLKRAYYLLPGDVGVWDPEHVCVRVNAAVARTPRRSKENSHEKEILMAGIPLRGLVHKPGLLLSVSVSEAKAFGVMTNLDVHTRPVLLGHRISGGPGRSESDSFAPRWK
jgi:hypothetical protein